MEYLKGMKIFLSRLLHWVHLLIACFVVFGCLMPFRIALLGHFFFVPGMLLHWKLNHNRCFLTDLEYRLQGIAPDTVKDEDGFVKSMLKTVFKEMPSPLALHVGIRVVALTSWLVTCGRLWVF
jgi:hypothetical protein